MPKGKRISIDDVREHMESVGCKLLSTNYRVVMDIVEYECKCGNTTSKIYKSFKVFPYCELCIADNKSKITKGRSKYTIDEVRKVFEDAGCKLLSTEYIGVNSKLKYECHCDREAEISFAKFKNGRRCMKCAIDTRANKRRHPYSTVVSDIKKMHYRLLTTEEEYIDASSPITLICNNNHIEKTTYRAILKGRTCTSCSGLAKHTIDTARAIFEKAGCELLETEYVNNNTKMKYKCSCGNASSIKLQNFIMGKRCYECRNSKISKAKAHDYEYIKSFFEENGCTLLSTEYENITVPLVYTCRCNREGRSSFATFKTNKRCRECFWDTMRNHDLTLEDREGRRLIDGYEEWRKSVFERDSYTCQCCGDNWSGKLNAHHLDGYHWCKERRTDISNGITLCETDHRIFHSIFGNKNNTEVQFDEFLINYNNDEYEELLNERRS